jgi:hypothetical protein
MIESPPSALAPEPRPANRGPLRASEHFAAIVSGLKSLLQLELELGWTEVRAALRALVIALVLAAVGVVLAIASLVVLAAGLLAWQRGLPAQPWLWAGGTGIVLGLGGIGWGIYRARNVPWPSQLTQSLEETAHWLAAQLRFRLRFG